MANDKDTPKEAFTAEEQIAKLQSELKKREDEVKELKLAVENAPAASAQEDQIPYSAKWKTPEGEDKKAKVKISNPTVRLRDDESSIVGSASLLKVAAGKTLTSDELAASPALAKVTKEAAGELITYFAKIEAGFIVIV